MLCIQVKISSNIDASAPPVGGLHRLPPKGKDLDEKRQRSKAGLHLGVTPAILRARYNLTAADVGSVQNNSQAVAQVRSTREINFCDETLDITAGHENLL